MIYYLLKTYVQFYIRVYFRKIYILGEEKIPNNKPTFIASNHPNGFLDGIVISAMLRRSTYIFVRGDVFKKMWSNFILRGMKLIPIFRVRDGNARQSIKENNASYDQLYRMFRKKKQVMIFPESDSRPVKRLRDLKKGTARIVLDMESRKPNEMQVSVVPTGMNYNKFHEMGNEVCIHLSDAFTFIEVRTIEMSDSAAMMSFTKDLHERMIAGVVHVPKSAENVAEIGFNLIRAAFPIGINKVSRDRSIYDLNYALGILLQEDQDQIVENLILDYNHALEENKLGHKSAQPSSFMTYVAMMLFLPALISFGVTSFFIKLGKGVADAKVQLPELYDSVMFGIGFASNMLFDLIMLLILGLGFGWKWVAVYLIFRLLGMGYYFSKDQIYRYRNNFKWQRLKLFDSRTYDKLVFDHKTLLDLFRETAEQHK